MTAKLFYHKELQSVGRKFPYWTSEKELRRWYHLTWIQRMWRDMT